MTLANRVLKPSTNQLYYTVICLGFIATSLLSMQFEDYLNTKKPDVIESIVMFMTIGVIPLVVFAICLIHHEQLKKEYVPKTQSQGGKEDEDM